MEEQILKIIRKHDAYLTTSKDMSKEITSHIMKFIEWFKLMDEIVPATNYSNLYHWYRKEGNYADMSEYSLEEVYQYWLNNVKHA